MKELCSHFNIMVDRIGALIAENNEKQKKLTKTEIAVLQAQINPHFLYNTLNSIRWLALINNQDQIKNMVDCLSNLLIHAFRVEEDYITLKEEYDLLISYVSIMKIRYKTFELRFEADEAACRCHVLKFTLQPFVENSILHGFQGINYMGIITIRAVLRENRLVIRIEDNGTGMSGENQALLTSPDTEEKSRGVGIANVQKRIQLHFGPEYGVSICDGMEKGAAVEITLPC